MRRAGAAIFWLGAATLAYTYAGYPAAVALAARRRARPVRRARITPTVSVIIAAHDEAAHIAAKIENCLALDYPRDRLEIIVASDGSTDATVAIARRYAAQGVQVVDFRVRRGKPAVLNRAIAGCRSELVALSDARQPWNREALRALVENFADPAVGAVSGELVLEPDGAAVGDGLGVYWRYEKAIRRAESAVDSTVGVTGAIYVIRRALFEPLPEDTLLDDVLVPMRIVRRGYRVVFDGRATARDRVSGSAGREFARKTRTIAGTAQLFARERWLWSPRANRVWAQALSHKLLRLVAPFALLTTLGSSAALARHSPFFRLVALAQAAFYGSAAVGAARGRREVAAARVVAVPYAFCLLNVTALAGLARYATGAQAVTWQRDGAAVPANGHVHAARHDRPAA